MQNDFDNPRTPDDEAADMGALRGMLPWYSRFLMRYFPRLWFRIGSRRLNIRMDDVDAAEKFFGGAERIDIQPLSGAGGRGFILTINNSLSLYFYQDGDHFSYDGFEMGEYDNGDVTVFDLLAR